jgi:hypothetical protein
MGSVFKRVKKTIKKVTKPISKVTKGIAKGIAKVAKSVMKGVAKLNKKLGPIGMIAMSIAMPYAMQGLGGGVNWLMARPEGTFLNAVGRMGNHVRVGWQGFKQGFTAAKNSITKSITDTFSSMGDGNNIFKRISEGAKRLYTKAKELTPKFRQGKIGTVEVGGQQMSSSQAYEMVQKGMIDASQLGKQTLGQSQGFFTKAGNQYDKLLTDVINESYADKIKLLDVNGTRHFNDLVQVSKDAGFYPNHGEIFNHMTSGNGTVPNYLDMTDDVISYTTDLAKTGDYTLGTARDRLSGTYTFNGNETFGKSLEPNKFKQFVNKNKKTIIDTGKSILKKSSDTPIIEPQEYPMVATNSNIGNEGTTAPLISAASVQGSTGTEFFKKVYGEPAWAKLKTVANHMGFEGDNTYSTQV